MVPDASVLWIVLFVLSAAVILDRFLFKPVQGVLGERERAIREAQELASGAAEKAGQATAELEATIQSARAELYREMDRTRRAAEDRRQSLMADTRREAEEAVAEAKDRVDRQAADARRRLEEQAGELGEAIAERVLGRRLSS
jgi:F-type H+-transporting ATPase subunit b